MTVNETVIVPAVEKCYNENCIGLTAPTAPENSPQTLTVKAKREAYFEFWDGRSWSKGTAVNRIQ